jgi:PAS domain S-box-containing protein
LQTALVDETTATSWHRYGVLVPACVVLTFSVFIAIFGLVGSRAGKLNAGHSESQPGTAAIFIILALSIVLLDSSRKWLRISARALAAGAVAAGLVATLRYWLVAGTARMDISPVTALSVLLTGGAVLLTDRRWGRFLPSVALSWSATALSFVTLTGFAYDAVSLDQLRMFSRVSIHTSASILLLCIAIMFLRPQQGAAGILLRDDPGGAAARRMLPATILMPFVVSLAIFKMHQAGGYGLALMVFLFVVAPVLVFVPLVLYSASLMSRMDRERQASEEQLRISRERLAGVVGSAMDAIITLDEHLNVIVFNQAAEKVFGCSVREAIGKPLDRFIPARFREAHSQHIQRFSQSGGTARSIVFPGLLSGMRANGEEFPIEATISQVRVAGRKLYTVILRDVTERKLAEETLRQSEERFRSIYEQAAVGIEQVALDGYWLMANAALCNMLGYEEDELQKMTIAEAMPHDDYQRELELRRTTQCEGLRSYEMEKRYRHRDGLLVWVHSISTLVSDGSGEPLYWISVIQDLTERKRAEEQLRQAQRMEAIGRLAGGIAHDFNTLLNVMLGYSDLLLTELPEGDQRRERVLQIKNAGDSGALLTKQLLAFSRKQVLSEEVNDLRQIATTITPILARLLHEDIEMSVFCSEEPCPVKADPGQIQQVVLNLVSNAADAMPDGGRLAIEVKPVEVDEAYALQHPTVRMGSYAMIAVRDTGHGMTGEILAHIFEPFFTTKEAGRGTGLGLSTVYGIIKRTGGDIWVYSEAGTGTVFKVFLPLDSSARKPSEKPGPRSMREIAARGETVLLAEDSEALRELTKVILVREGYHVLEAEDGQAALELAEHFEGTIDLLLTDVMMPRMRGPRLAEELIRRRPGIAVVFLSGYADEAIAPPNSRRGFQMVEKPYVAKALLEVLRRALEDARQNAVGR